MLVEEAWALLQHMMMSNKMVRIGLRQERVTLTLSLVGYRLWRCRHVSRYALNVRTNLQKRLLERGPLQAQRTFMRGTGQSPSGEHPVANTSMPMTTKDRPRFRNENRPFAGSRKSLTTPSVQCTLTNPHPHRRSETTDTSERRSCLIPFAFSLKARPSICP